MLPQLHTQLGLMKHFVKALNKEGNALIHLKNIFPQISDAKLMAGILNCPQIRELMRNDNFARNMNNKEIKPWLALKDIIKYFLGNQKPR